HVLFVDKGPGAIADILRKPENEVRALLNSGRRKMREARSRRKSPFVDRTVYANWNAMMVVSYFEAFKAFRREDCRSFGLKSLDLILHEHRSSDGLITHRPSSVAQEAFLDDQVETAQALLSAFEVTGDRQYETRSVSLMEKTLELFWDGQAGGFFDVPRNHRTVGALSVPNKPIQDSPTASANAVGISILTRLAILTENSSFRDFAEKTLLAFAGTVKDSGLFGATYFRALDEFLNPPPHVLILTDETDELGERLFRKALAAYRPGTIVTRQRPNAAVELPATIKAAASSYSKPVAYVCTNFTCAPPVFDELQLETTIKDFARPANSLK
ncbi:MAG: hypothetical protein WBD36_14460, partial [Bacteroidota bacterium]